MKVQRFNLQFPSQRDGCRWIADRRVASLILQLTRYGKRFRRPEHCSSAGAHLRDRYGDVLRDSELAFEHWHLLLDGLQVQDLGTRIERRCGFDSSGWVQHKLHRFVALDSRRVDMNARWELNIHHESQSAAGYDSTIRL